MRIVIGSDHAGFDLKSFLGQLLESQGYEVLDVGTTSSTVPADYPDSAAAVGAALQNNQADRGILVCGSGVGASIAANKVPGVRAAICHDSYSAHQGVEHDDMNVLVLGARIIGTELAKELTRAFLAARFSGEDRHARRLAKVLALEAHPPRPLPRTEPDALVAHMRAHLPTGLAVGVHGVLEDWRTGDKARRMWFKDPGLWTGRDEGNWLGWLNIADEQLAAIDHLTRFASEVKAAGFTHILLLGMGGSSLGSEVLARTFGHQPGWPELVVLDSTDPRQIAAYEARVQLATTLVIVSSKSGSTLEPNILKDYFFARKVEVCGSPAAAAAHFVAVTDPGSPFEKVARDLGFRWIFQGVKSIGGRYSVLSNFGMVPAAAMGLDVGRLLDRAADMARACAAPVPPEDNPGVALGAMLGEAARRGIDKLTLVASQGLRSLGTWLEQLIAESTGKNGLGIIPIDREALGPPRVYGNDRLFVHLRLADEPDHIQDQQVGQIERSGHPVIRIVLPGKSDLGAEFFRWEVATAVAGAVIGINPFDQPDVEASKIETRKLTDAYEATGSLPAETPIWSEDDVAVYVDPANAAALGSPTTLEGWLTAHLNRTQLGDYVALLAYLPMSDELEKILEAMRSRIRDTRQVATCVEYGPRFLHSTGQAYKGGPNSGVFLQLTCDEPADLAVPGRKFTFGVVKAAQARGDLAVLTDRGRRVIRLHLGSDLNRALTKLQSALSAALPM